MVNNLSKVFSSTNKYDDKTIRSIYFGIGSQKIIPVGKTQYTYHKITPVDAQITTYKPASDTSSSSAEYNVFPRLYSRNFEISDVRGARFGLYNIQPIMNKYHFRFDSYGQFRDMLEQGLDSKFAKFKDNNLVYGSPVNINAINPINPEVTKLMSGTQRFNKKVDCSIVKPYIEGKGGHNLNIITQPLMLQSETLRVDVPGSIKTKATVSPLNIASNIRTRS